MSDILYVSRDMLAEQCFRISRELGQIGYGARLESYSNRSHVSLEHLESGQQVGDIFGSNSHRTTYWQCRAFLRGYGFRDAVLSAQDSRSLGVVHRGISELVDNYRAVPTDKFELVCAAIERIELLLRKDK
jgi:hypothetical protein